MKRLTVSLKGNNKKIFITRNQLHDMTIEMDKLVGIEVIQPLLSLLAKNKKLLHLWLIHVMDGMYERGH